MDGNTIASILKQLSYDSDRNKSLSSLIQFCSEIESNDILDTAYYMVFGRPHVMTIDENIRKWQKEIRTQMRQLENQINKLTRENVGVEKQIKILAKKGEKSNTKTLVKEIVR